MSYDIRLCDPVTHEALQTDVPHDMRGGTYAMGGTTGLWLNVTYNYGKHYYRVLGDKDIRTIYGMTGAESTPCSKRQRPSCPTRFRTTTGRPPRATPSARCFSWRRWPACAQTAFGTVTDDGEGDRDAGGAGKLLDMPLREVLRLKPCRPPEGLDVLPLLARPEALPELVA